MSDLRKTLHSAYTLIRSIEVNKASSAITLDHLIQEQIVRMKKNQTSPVLDSKGESHGNRVSYFDALETLSKEIEDVVKAVRDAGNDSEKLLALGLFEAVDEADTGSSGGSS